MRYKIFTIIIGMLLINSTVYAACTWEGNTGTVASPYASADVNDCVTDSSSKTGAVVITIPATSPDNIPTWTSAATVDMSTGFASVTSLTIQGASKTGTVINNPRFVLTAATNKKLILKTMSWTGTQQVANGNIVSLQGATSPLDSTPAGFRVGDITMTITNDASARIIDIISSDVAGVIDNNSVTTGSQFLRVSGKNTTPWAADDPFGTANAVYLEGNTLNMNALISGRFARMVADQDTGGRLVARYNTLTDYYFGGHDYLGWANGVRSWEIHNNHMTFTGPNNSDGYFFSIRGGTGYIYNNYLTSTQTAAPTSAPLAFTNYRSVPVTGSIKTTCDGTAENACSDFTGGHCTGDGTTCSSDAGCVDHGGGTCSWTCSTNADCPNGTTCTQVDGHYTGDDHPTDDGWPCRDQIGRGKNQTARPALVWGNLRKWYGGSDTAFSATSAVDHVTLDRDYCNHDTSTTCGGVSSSYTAYTCPHPLTGLTGSCATTGETMYGTTGYNIEAEADTTAPTVTISTSNSTITSDSLTVTGTSVDAVGVSGCKFRIGSAPDASNGTACTGTTSFSCATSGYASGANTLYVGCYDAAGNYGSDSIIVTFTPPTASGCSFSGGGMVR